MRLPIIRQPMSDPIYIYINLYKMAFVHAELKTVDMLFVIFDLVMKTKTLNWAGNLVSRVYF